MKNLICLFFFPPVLLLGCSSSEYCSPIELKQFILQSKNGLVKKMELNGYSVEVIFRPTDLLIEQEIKGDTTEESKLKFLQSKYEPYYYFILNVSKDSREALVPEGHASAYSELVQTMSYRMLEYVNISTVQDTVPPTDFILERSYGLSNATSLMFVFNREKLKGKEWIQFNLGDFGLGLGNHRFRFMTKNIEKAPHINFIF